MVRKHGSLSRAFHNHKSLKTRIQVLMGRLFLRLLHLNLTVDSQGIRTALNRCHRIELKTAEVSVPR